MPENLEVQHGHFEFVFQENRARTAARTAKSRVYRIIIVFRSLI